MSKKLYATNGFKYWKADPKYKNQVLAMLEEGRLVVLTNRMSEGWSIDDLPKGFYYTEKEPTEEQLDKKVVEKEKCFHCGGKGRTSRIVDHDADYNSVWEKSRG
jgi:hypothetical protein